VRPLLRIVFCVALCQIALPVRASAVNGFPFELRDGFLWVEVSMARASQPLHFLVDTGAGVSVIDQHVAERRGLRGGQHVTVAGVQAATTGFWPIRVSAKIGDVPLPHNYLAIDLTTLSRACATPVDGLLGADFFHGKVVQFDFRERVIRILTPDQGQKLQGESLALEIRSCGMRVPVSINGGKPQWLRLDTGCAAPLHWVTSSVEPKDCRRELAIGLAELSLPTVTVSAGLGSNRFEHIGAVIHEREIFAGESGLLGVGLLSRFATVTVDSRAKRLILAK